MRATKIKDISHFDVFIANLQCPVEYPETCENSKMEQIFAKSYILDVRQDSEFTCDICPILLGHISHIITDGFMSYLLATLSKFSEHLLVLTTFCFLG